MHSSGRPHRISSLFTPFNRQRRNRSAKRRRLNKRFHLPSAIEALEDRVLLSTVDFDALAAGGGSVTGAALDAYLAGFGITISNVTPTGYPEVHDSNNDSGFTTASSSSNFLSHGDGVSGPIGGVAIGNAPTNDPISYTLNFSTPLDSLSFTRIQMNAFVSSSGIVTAEWSARALDSVGNTIATVGEPGMASYSVIPAADFTLTGPGITALVVERTSTNFFAGVNAVFIDDLVLGPQSQPNQPPVLAAIGNRSVDEGSELTFTATATDPDPGQSLSFSLDTGAPAGATINPTTGVFTWTPTEAQGPGNYSATIRVTDSGSPPLSDVETMTISVAEVNQPPVIAPIDNQSVDEGSTLRFTVSVSDPDTPANNLTPSLQVDPLPDPSSDFRFDPVTGEVSWTPTETDGPGTYQVTLQVTDDGSPPLSDEQTFTITVADVNQPPVADAGGPYSINGGDPLTLDASASSDPDGDPLTFSWDVNGDNVFGDATGATPTLTWSQLAALGINDGAGSRNIQVRVDDGQGGVATASTPLSVLNVAPNWIFEAESDLRHQVGRQDSDGWSANTRDDAPGFLSFGPYTTAVPAGPQTATFRLMVDNNTFDNSPVVRLDVYDVTAGRILSEGTIRRQQFRSAFTYQEFTLDFTAEEGHTLEFRTQWFRTSYVRQDKVTVTAEGGAPSEPSLSIDDVTLKPEGDSGTTNAVFTVSLSAVSSSDVTVDFATADGTATEGDDYTATNGSLTIPAGATSANIEVPVLGDTLEEGNETFVVTLSNPANAAIADGEGTATIIDDDGPPLLVFEAESDLKHQVGRRDADGWSANTRDDPPGFLNFGPYTTAVSAGPQTATFRLMVDNNTADNSPVVKLDVFDANAGRALAERLVTRREFTGTFTYQDFALDFTAEAGHQLEFRTQWFRTSYVRQDGVTVTTNEVTPPEPPPPSPSTALLFEAESDLQHQIGRADVDGWSANTRDDRTGFLSFGPYTTAVPAGPQTATFRLLVDNNTADNSPVVKLDVFDATAGRVLAERVVTRQEFRDTFAYQGFALGFTAETGHRLEFRTFWERTSYVRQDGVDVTNFRGTGDVAVTDAQGQVTLNINGQQATFELLDERTGEPLSGLSVAVGMDEEHPWRAVLTAADPDGETPLQIVVLEGQPAPDPSQALTALTASTDEIVVPPPVVQTVRVKSGIGAVATGIVQTVLHSGLLGQPPGGTGEPGEGLVPALLYAFDQLRSSDLFLPPPLTGVLPTITDSETLPIDEAIQKAERDVATATDTDLANAWLITLPTASAEFFLTATPPGFATFATITLNRGLAQARYSAVALYDVFGATQISFLTIRFGGIMVKIPVPHFDDGVDVEKARTSLPPSDPVNLSVSQPDGSAAAGGSYELISKDYPGLGFQGVLDTQGNANIPVPLGDYQLRVVDEGSEPITTDVSVPAGGTTVSLGLPGLSGGGGGGGDTGGGGGGDTGGGGSGCDLSVFDGTWTGGYSGTGVVSGFGSVPASGSVTVVVSNGVITVTDPGGGQGSLDCSGSANFAGTGGIGSVGNASYSFSGGFDAASGSASGSWFATFPGGSASGGWSLGRNGLQTAHDTGETADQATILTHDDLTALADEAIARWQAAGLDEAAVQTLNHVNIEVTDLPGTYLGLATAEGIFIDQDAAGTGWFIDGTPSRDEEFGIVLTNFAFQADGNSPAAGRLDLLTALAHEMGHVLGLGHVDAQDAPYHLMAGTLQPGVRRLPSADSVDAVFTAEQFTDLLQTLDGR